jgi:hypothetical protein
MPPKRTTPKKKRTPTKHTCERTAEIAQKKCSTMKLHGKTKKVGACSDTFEKSLARCKARQGTITITKVELQPSTGNLHYALPKSKATTIQAKRIGDMQKLMTKLKQMKAK